MYTQYQVQRFVTVGARCYRKSIFRQPLTLIRAADTLAATMVARIAWEWQGVLGSMLVGVPSWRNRARGVAGCEPVWGYLGVP